MIKYGIILITIFFTGCGATRSITYHNTCKVTIVRDAKGATVTGIITKGTNTWTGKTMTSISTNIIANPVCRVEYGNNFKIEIKNDQTGEGIEMTGLVNRDLGDDQVTISVIENSP